MALDVNALKNKLKSFNRNAQKEERNAKLWSPQEGKSTVRIVPLKTNPSNPFVELKFHYTIGNRTYLSPSSFGRPDPIEEFAEAIIADESMEVKERYQQAKPFRPKARTYLPVIVRGEEDKGVRFYAFGAAAYKQIISYMVDEDYGDITDPKTGRDVTIEYVPKEKSDTKLPQTTIKVKPNQTPLSADAKVVEKWLTDQPDITELFEEPSYDELKAALHKFLDGGTAVATEPTDAPEQKEEPKSVTETVAGPKKSPSFDDIFGND